MPLRDTRLRRIPGQGQAIASGGGTTLQWVLPKTGALRAIDISIPVATLGTVSGSPVTAFGASAIVKRVSVILSGGTRVFNVSGEGYHHILRDYLEAGMDVIPQTNGRSALTTALACVLDMHIPIALNSRDEVGLVPLQTEEMQTVLEVEFRTLAQVDSGLTSFAGTVVPEFEVLSLPPDQKQWPDFLTLHTCIEDQRTVSGAGLVTYPWPLSDTYVQMLHALAPNTTAADLWTQAQLVVNNHDIIEDYVPNTQNLVFAKHHGRARRLGNIGFDFIASSGLGNYASARDLLDTSKLTQVDSKITASAAGILFAIRRTIVTLTP